MLCARPGYSQVNYPIPQDSTSEWRIWTGQWDPLTSWYSNADQKVFVAGDTTINGRIYSRLVSSGMHSITYQGVTNSWPFEKAFYAFIRTDSACTYISLGDEEELLYDFTLQAGDTLPETMINWNTVVVSSVDSVLVAGKYLKRFNIYDSINQDLMSNWYIEGIGHEFGLVEPMYMMLDNGNWFECYAENHLPVFPEGTECDLAVKLIEDVIHPDAFLVYPNPSRGAITIEYSSDHPEMVRLMVAGNLGDILLDHPWELDTGKNKISLELSAARPGLFFIILIDGQSFLREKFVLVK